MKHFIRFLARNYRKLARLLFIHIKQDQAISPSQAVESVTANDSKNSTN